jgi:hypothetical protein
MFDLSDGVRTAAFAAQLVVKGCPVSILPIPQTCTS